MNPTRNRHLPFWSLNALALFAASGLLAGSAGARAAETADAKGKGDKPAAKENVHTVAAEPLNVNLEFNATVESRDVSEVSVVPEEWNDLVVEKAVEHGARVRKGDQLVKFDTQRLDQTIGDLESEGRLNALAIKQTREGLDLLKRTVPLQLAEAERAAKQSAEDLKEFLEKGKPRTLEEIEVQFKSNQQYVAYQEEELKQLEKMYAADDLVADTEEIVLKRARFEVDVARHRMKQAEAMREWNLTYGLPRQETNLKNAVEMTGLGLERAKATLPQAVIESELRLAKLVYDDGKKQQRLAGLKRDRERMVVRAPADGTVYYGEATRGSWPSADQASGSLKVGAQVRPHQVLLSIVDPRSLQLRATAEESQVRHLRPGLRGTFRPTIDPKQSLPATLGKIEPVPIATGKFDIKIDAEVPGGGKGLPLPLMPGMGGQARFLVYSNPKAVVVPAAAIKEDDDDEQAYVMVMDDEGKAERRNVTVGEKQKDQVEILEGLKEGEKVQVEQKK